MTSQSAKRAKAAAEAKSKSSLAQLKAAPPDRPAVLTLGLGSSRVDLRPRVLYIPVAQAPRYRDPSDSTGEWRKKALGVMNNKIFPHTVLLDLDMTVWPNFADRDLTPPAQVDVSKGCPAVRLGNGQTLEVANETAGIIRA